MKTPMFFAQQGRSVWQTSSLGQRWQALPERDRSALLALAGFVLLALAYLLLWQPVQRSALEAQQTFAEQRELYSYVQSRAGAVAQLPASVREVVDPARLQGLVAESATQLGVVVERLDQDGDASVQVVLQPLAFAQLIAWQGLLEQQGVTLTQAAIERAEAGLVRARLSLSAAP